MNALAVLFAFPPFATTMKKILLPHGYSNSLIRTHTDGDTKRAYYRQNVIFSLEDRDNCITTKRLTFFWVYFMVLPATVVIQVKV
jgi:hypothetical protein